MSYNLNIQKGLGKNAVLQVGYVGMEARRLLVVTDINEAAPGSGFLPGTDAQGFTYQQASRPYFSQYPNFGVINQISSSGTSNYNSLQVTFRTRVWHGVSTQFNYTWAHSLDEITAYVGAIPQDSTNFKNDYGNSDFDIRHNFSGYVVYDIPGAHWGPQWLTHGWEATSKMQFHTGEPFTRLRQLRYQRHRRKYDARRTGGQSLCRREPRASARPAGAVDQSGGVRGSGAGQLRIGGPKHLERAGLRRRRSGVSQEHTH